MGLTGQDSNRASAASPCLQGRYICIIGLTGQDSDRTSATSPCLYIRKVHSIGMYEYVYCTVYSVLYNNQSWACDYNLTRQGIKAFLTG